jgi:hypothetical protein
MQKPSIKHLQTEFNNTLKRSFITTKWVSFHGRNDGSTIMQINKCNIAHKQNQEQNHMIVSVDVEKVFDKNLTSLHDKSPKET